MKVEIRRSLIWQNEWQWTCPVCHYGNDIPWETSTSWPEAMAEVATHIALHRTTGQRLEWAPIPTH